MFKFLIFLASVACAYGAVFNPLVLRGFPSRIVGGEAIEITQAPHQVALLYDSAGSGSYSLRCGGSIAGKGLIVTAAHCVYLTSQTRWKVRVGSNLYSAGGQLITVLSHKNNEKYSSNTIDFDIAVMKLASDIIIDNNSTKIIPLASQNQTVADNSTAIASGWGSTISGGSVVSQLRSVQLKTVNQAVCKTAYSGFNTITDNMICAGNYEQGGQDACQGDSGGPLVVNGVLVGVTSWGRGCALQGYPGVWTRVPALRSWIDQNA